MNAVQKQIQTALAATLALLAGLSLVVLVGCKDKPRVILDKPDTVGEKIQDRVDDALDRRPGEKIRDAAEDIEDAVNR